jgi:predicted RNA-binding Zn-ribbon protein involved in translation (DUF1610 family)
MIGQNEKRCSASMISCSDGMCVSCGRNPGALYWHCPYCGEAVWHSTWRRILSVYALVLLPLFLILMLALERILLLSLLAAWYGSSWQLRLLSVVAAGMLLLPYEDRRLIYTSKLQRLGWLLNALAASAILLLCALTFALHLRFAVAGAAGHAVVAVITLSGVAVFFVSNCGWRQLLGTLFLMILLAICSI